MKELKLEELSREQKIGMTLTALVQSIVIQLLRATFCKIFL